MRLLLLSLLLFFASVVSAQNSIIYLKGMSDSIISEVNNVDTEMIYFSYSNKDSLILEGRIDKNSVEKIVTNSQVIYNQFFSKINIVVKQDIGVKNKYFSEYRRKEKQKKIEQQRRELSGKEFKTPIKKRGVKNKKKEQKTQNTDTLSIHEKQIKEINKSIEKLSHNSYKASYHLVLSADYDIASMVTSFGAGVLIVASGGSGTVAIGVVGIVATLSCRIASIYHKRKAGEYLNS